MYLYLNNTAKQGNLLHFLLLKLSHSTGRDIDTSLFYKDDAATKNSSKTSFLHRFLVYNVCCCFFFVFFFFFFPLGNSQNDDGKGGGEDLKTNFGSDYIPLSSKTDRLVYLQTVKPVYHQACQTDHLYMEQSSVLNSKMS